MPEPNPSTAVTPFAFEGRQVRAVTKDGAPWFVAADVCSALDIANSRDALDKLDADEKGVALTDTLGGAQSVNVISESGLYTLILRCRDATKPGTLPHRFRKWVTAEVLPTIRKTGGYTAPAYSPPNPYSPDKIAAVREARLTFGRAAAQKVWHAAGLPPVSPLPEEPRQSSMFDPPAANRPTLADLPALSRPRSARTLAADLLARIDARVAAGATIRAACEAEGANYQTVRNKTHLMRAAARHQH